MPRKSSRTIRKPARRKAARPAKRKTTRTSLVSSKKKRPARAERAWQP